MLGRLFRRRWLSGASSNRNQFPCKGPANLDAATRALPTATHLQRRNEVVALASPRIQGNNCLAGQISQEVLSPTGPSAVGRPVAGDESAHASHPPYGALPPRHQRTSRAHQTFERGKTFTATHTHSPPPLPPQPPSKQNEGGSPKRKTNRTPTRGPPRQLSTIRRPSGVVARNAEEQRD